MFETAPAGRQHTFAYNVATTECLTQVLTLAAGRQRTFAYNVAIPECQTGQVLRCSTPQHTNMVSIAFVVALSAASMVITCCLLFWKLRQHRQLPYQVVQTGTIFFRLQVGHARYRLCLTKLLKLLPDTIYTLHQLLLT